MTQTSKLSIDHIVHYVDNLDIAIEDFQKNGFTVLRGGIHSGGLTQNAMIHFLDGTYIELISFTNSIQSTFFKWMFRLHLSNFIHNSPRMTVAKRVVSRMALCPQGMIDFAVKSRSFKDDYNRICQEGVQLSTPAQMTRKLPDLELSWQMSIPKFHGLPFLISDYNVIPVLSQDAAIHENGAIGISKIIVFTNTLKKTSENYQAFLGIDAEIINSESKKAILFRSTPSIIEIVSPKNPKMDSSGYGIFALEFKFPNQTNEAN